MRKIIAVAATAAVLATTAAAQAGSLGRPCTSAPQSQWLSLPELQAKVEALGYRVQKGKVKNACGELIRSTRPAAGSSCSSTRPMARLSVSCDGMSLVTHPIGAGGVTPPATVKVWDLFVRVFHWSLATLFVVAYATGDEIERVHITAGYAIAGLLLLRVAWGFVGSRPARFADFVRPPREVLAYLRDVLLRRERRYLGHNPAGGIMVVALLAALSATCVTGVLMTTDAFWGAKWVEEVHEACANLTLSLVVFHILGVLVTSFGHRENLVKAMVTGGKAP
jgi:cytochrome b